MPHEHMKKYGVEVVYPELSYIVVGVLFKAHRKIGRYGKEKQYSDLVALMLKGKNIHFKREYTVVGTGNRLDFVIEDKLIIELKARQIMIEADYAQLKRYLHITKLQLGLLVNFRDKHLKPKRILNLYT